MKNIRFVLAILLLGSLAVSLTTCGGSSDSSVTIASISVSPAIPVGSTQKFTAIGAYSDGTSHDLTPLVTWTSSNTSAATVNNSGRATALAAGTTTITATFGSISGSTTLTVTPATLSSITVTPANPSVPAGVNQQFTALGTYSDGTRHDITPHVTWTSSNPAAATIIISSGLATAGTAAGTATIITATSGSISGSTTLTVTSATLSSIAVTPANPSISTGATLQFTALGTYSDTTSHDLTTQVTWTSSNPAAATITSSSGLATAITAGTATITATSGSISGSTTLTVTSAALSSIAVIPSIPVGATQQLVAIGTNSDGSTQDITQAVSWTSANTLVATINGSGQATAIAAGAAFLVANTQVNFLPLQGATTLLVTP